MREATEERTGPFWLQTLLASIWFGLVTGLLEATVFTIVRYIPGLITWRMRQGNVSFDFFWIAPLVNLAGFVVVGIAILALEVATLPVPRLRPLRHAGLGVMVYAGLCAYLVLRVPDRLQQDAAALLALGIAVRTWQWYRADTARRDRFFRRSLIWIVLVVAAATGLTHGATTLSERAAVAQLLPPPASPNVLLIVLDTVRADHLPIYGYPRNTMPTLSAFARESVVFDQARATSSWTLPAHASLFTGRYVHEHGADTEHPELDGQQATLADTLSRAGFVTVGISANTTWVTRNTGLAKGFIHFEDYFHSVDDAMLRSVIGREFLRRVAGRLGHQVDERKPGAVVTTRFLSWLDRSPARPYFAFLNYYDTHTPYISPAPYQAQFMTEAERRGNPAGMWNLQPSMRGEITADEDRLLTNAYNGALSYLDANLGALLDGLRQRGQLDRTIVVIVADHGESLGDHDFYGHGNSLYADQVHVPLLIRFPNRVPAGRRVADPVTVADLPATILDLAGADSATPSLPGQSLARFWTSHASDAQTRPVLSEVGRHERTPAAWPVSEGWVASITRTPWTFIARQNGRTELYHVTDDPTERHNRADSDEGRAVAASLAAALAQARGEPATSADAKDPQYDPVMANR